MAVAGSWLCIVAFDAKTKKVTHYYFQMPKSAPTLAYQ